MAGIEDKDVIDLVLRSESGEEAIVVMVEDRPWGESPDQIDQLLEKVNLYANFVLDGGLIRKFPDLAGKPVRVQLDCIEPPNSEANEVIALARKGFAQFGIPFDVRVL